MNLRLLTLLMLGLACLAPSLFAADWRCHETTDRTVGYNDQLVIARLTATYEGAVRGDALLIDEIISLVGGLAAPEAEALVSPDIPDREIYIARIVAECRERFRQRVALAFKVPQPNIVLFVREMVHDLALGENRGKFPQLEAIEREVQQRRDALYAALVERLPDRERQVMRLSAAGNGPAAIARTTGINVETVRAMINRWDERFREAVNTLPVPETPREERRFVALAFLPNQERRAFLLHERGQTIEDIAKALGVSARGARVLLSRARANYNVLLDNPVEALRAENNPDRALFLRVLRFLDDNERQIMTLRLEGLSAPDIAGRTGIGQNIVKNTISRVEKRLEEAFSEWDEPNSDETTERNLAMTTLPPLQRQIVTMHFNGVSDQNMMAALSINLRTLATTRSQGLKNLEETLQRGRRNMNTP